jgi:hypothetical protein
MTHNSHSITDPPEHDPDCPALSYVVGGKVAVVGLTGDHAAHLKMVIGKVFGPDEDVPALPPRDYIAQGYVEALRETTLRRYYYFIYDREIPDAEIGVVNTVVTWALFDGNGHGKTWVRSDFDRKFFGIPR